MQPNLQNLSNGLRVLCADVIERAGSGHPGLPLGMADVATVLWTHHLKYNPHNPDWYDRDRFVLSAGHGSALLYALLYLTGFKGITLEHLKSFRQLHSGTPGHPEYGHLPGIETTTGPLGQGLANAVGMAMAERKLSNYFGQALVDHHTYCLVGDGCLMERISQEAISLAGHLRLNKLIVLWDNNGITIDGSTSLSTSEDQIHRFQSCGWDTIEVDGHQFPPVLEALTQAKHNRRPTLIACKTIIGFGAPNKQGTPEVHGSALGLDEINALRHALQHDAPPFELIKATLQTWRKVGERSIVSYKNWLKRYASSPYKDEFYRWHHTLFEAESNRVLKELKESLLQQPNTEATRKSSERCLSALVNHIPNLVGGSADLTPSNNTKPKALNPIVPDNFEGRYIHYGIREHAMAGIMNGLSLHGGLRPYGGTFLCFSDYARPAIRLSALMEQPVIYVMTHDSIGLGEDGPTHQPIEHLASLRAVPNLNVFRPCDAIETAECWELAIASSSTPIIMALSRQNLPLLRTTVHENLSAKGGYIIRPSDGKRTFTLVATGSEVHLAIAVAKHIETQTDHRAAVVSMPCWELFEAQSGKYHDTVLGHAPKISI
jgi:transketolase